MAVPTEHSPVREFVVRQDASSFLATLDRTSRAELGLARLFRHPDPRVRRELARRLRRMTRALFAGGR